MPILPTSCIGLETRIISTFSASSPRRSGDHRRELADALDVPAGVGIASLDCTRESRDRPDPRRARILFGLSWSLRSTMTPTYPTTSPRWSRIGESVTSAGEHLAADVLELDFALPRQTLRQPRDHLRARAAAALSKPGRDRRSSPLRLRSLHAEELHRPPAPLLDEAIRSGRDHSDRKLFEDVRLDAELVRRLLPLGDVLGGAEHPHWGALRVHLHATVASDRPDFAGLGDHAKDLPERLCRSQGSFDDLEERGFVVGVHVVDKFVVARLR